MGRRVSRRNLAIQRSQEVFAGRTQALDDFRRNLGLSDEERKLVWMVVGEGGIGKTTLLRRYRAIASNPNDYDYATAWVDEFTPASVVSVMGAIADQLETQGRSLKAFRDRYNVYRQRQSEIEADPERPKGIATAIGRVGGRLGVELLKSVPIAGGMATELLGEERLVEVGGEIADFVARKIGNKDEVRLVLSPIEVLTPLFVQGLYQVTEQQHIVLFFDTYEQTGTYLDRWLVDLLHHTYGELAVEVLVVIAGRNPLSQNWMSEQVEPFLEMVRLEPFTEEESRDYLSRRGIQEEAVVEVILRLSGGIPVLLTTLASTAPDDPEALGDPTGDAISRFLKWIGEEAERQAILTCALPRTLNLDIVKALLGDEEAEAMFDLIKRLSFVSRPADARGWVYHSTVREFMLRDRSRESPQRWQELHRRLAQYYAEVRDAMSLDLREGLQDEKWQQLDLSWLYHTICAEARGAEELWVTRVLEAYEHSAPATYTQGMGVRIQEASAALGDGAIVGWGQQVAEGFEAARASDYDHLIQFLNSLMKVVKNLPNELQAIASIWLGRVNYDSGNYSSAVNDFDSAVELQPERGNTYLWRGATHFNLQNREAAIADFSHAIKLQPQDSDSYFWRGQSYRDSGSHEAAITDFSRAIELQPQNPDNYHWRGRSYHDTGKHEAAITDFSRAIELQPSNGDTYFWRGQSHRDSGNHEAAITDFSRAIELQPQDPYNHRWRGRSYHDTGKHEAAIADFSHAIELQPQDPYNYFWRGHSYHDTGNHEAAIADFSHAIELQPQDPYNYLWRGLSYLHTDNHEVAIADLSHAIQLQPDNGHHYFVRAMAHAAIENAEALKEDFQRACELDPSFVTTFFEGLSEALKNES